MTINMIEYKKILVPHAGTPSDDKALSHAIKIAKFANSSLTILHVIEPVPHPKTIGKYKSEKSLHKKFDEIKLIMKDEMEQEMQRRLELCKKENIDTTLKITNGYPAEEIAMFVKRDHVDLIVMAERREMPRFKKILKLGSVSRKVLEYNLCPIFIVNV